MKSKQLDELARRCGISLTRPSPDDQEIPISNETKRKILAALKIELRPKKAPPKSSGKADAYSAKSRSMKKKTPKAYLPEVLSRTRVWGISLQLYELRSSRNWGIGDFEDLSVMADLVRSLGGDFIGLNPLHAPFLADPGRCSPYEPSNRQRLNPLYVAVDQVPGFASSLELDRRLEDLRQTDLVDYVGVTRIKLTILRSLWACWRKGAPRHPVYDPADFEAFLREGRKGLRRHALFEAISFSMVKSAAGAGWHTWPAEYQNPDSPAVVEFERENADEVRFHMWLQWLAHRQLARAAEHARKVGLRIGFYLDLAVGEAIDGSATWSKRDIYIAGATIGSPPDPFATQGQDWHLAAFRPSTIASGKHSPYRRMVSVAMRYAGAIRIDHAAALRRLFLVPLDSPPEAGAYVDYPQRRLLKILAKASARYRCVVIGEDLGTLPQGLQDDLSEAQILSYRVLSYERDKSGFKPAEVYPALALACISTHDHETLAGWWRGRDIKARAEHGIVPPEVTQQHVKERKSERRDLMEALDDAGLDPPARLTAKTADEETLHDLADSAHRFIARTPSLLAAVRLADLTSEKRPTNVPGTGDGYPNWKPKLSVAIENFGAIPLVARIAAAMRNERPKE